MWRAGPIPGRSSEEQSVPDAAVVREGFSEEAKLEPVSKDGELDKRAGQESAILSTDSYKKVRVRALKYLRSE